MLRYIYFSQFAAWPNSCISVDLDKQYPKLFLKNDL